MVDQLYEPSYSTLTVTKSVSHTHSCTAPTVVTESSCCSSFLELKKSKKLTSVSPGHPSRQAPPPKFMAVLMKMSKNFWPGKEVIQFSLVRTAQGVREHAVISKYTRMKEVTSSIRGNMLLPAWMGARTKGTTYKESSYRLEEGVSTGGLSGHADQSFSCANRRQL